jgi:methylthioribose-1-phosphate isomerase
VDGAGDMRRIRIAACGAAASNPAFDVTPYANVTAIVSEDGVWMPPATR